MAQRRRSGSGPGTRNRSRRGDRHGIIEIVTRPQQHRFWRMVGLVIRLRAELTVVITWITVHTVTATWWNPPQTAESGAQPDVALIVMIVTTVVVFAFPASRRFVTGRVFAVITRHRMRTCFVQARTYNHNGRTPFLLWSRPSPVGIRVRVWLPAGLAVKDLEHVAEELATACWARETRITPSRKQAAFVVVDIVRADPLSTGESLTPDVFDHIDDPGDNSSDLVRDRFRERPLPPLPPLPPAGDNEPIPVGGNRTTRKTDRPDRSDRKPDRVEIDAGQVIGFDGADVSDYI